MIATITGEGRARFHSAPDPVCRGKKFLIPNDRIFVHAQGVGWAYVSFQNEKTGLDTAGWIPENRLRPTGEKAAPLASTSATEPLPLDVYLYLSDREMCEHFAGEEPYDAERRADLNRQTDRFCTGIDTRLTSLRQKYAATNELHRRLQALEPLF